MGLIGLLLALGDVFRFWVIPNLVLAQKKPNHKIGL